MKNFWIVEKEFLTKKGFDYQGKGESNEVSKHESYFEALEVLKSENQNVLTWQDLNAKYDEDLTILTISEALVDNDGEVYDYLPEDDYVVVK